MTIVFDARTANEHFPGIGRYVSNLVAALRDATRDRDLQLLCDPSARGVIPLPNLPRIVCPVSPFSIRQQWIVPRRLRQARATLYHSPYYLMPYRPGVPTVVTCHDMIPLIFPRSLSTANRLTFYLTNVLAWKTARVIIAISASTRSDLMRYFRVDAQKVVVIPEAVDPRFAPQSDVAIAHVRSKYALPVRYGLYVGINKPHKNLATLLEAWQCVETDAALVIAGAWDERYAGEQRRGGAEEQSKIENRKSKVRFLHNVDDRDLPALYAGATVFVMPSLYEGFGLTPLEAMACGTPVICSNASSLPEVVGDAALLVNPRNAEEIAQAIARVLDDAALRDEMCAKSLARAAQFSWERSARETLELYRGIQSKYLILNASERNPR